LKGSVKGGSPSKVPKKSFKAVSAEAVKNNKPSDILKFI
jgi:hypothetical protein